MKLEVKAKNYVPGSISFSDGFGLNRKLGDFVKYVDGEKARYIIKKLLSEDKEIDSAELGLDGDFNCNSTTIYYDGDFFEYDAYEGSQWAEPILIVNYCDGSNEAYSCWYRNLETTANIVDSETFKEVKQIESKL